MFMINSSFMFVPSPINLSLMWNFGSMLVFLTIFQILTGIIISFTYFNMSSISFNSVESLMRSIWYGSSFRLVHMNFASLIFLFLFLHLFRGLLISAYKFKDTWSSGVSILLISMLIAFLGYVLPWGQMSFWAATVITKFLSAIPIIGPTALMWVLSSFSVDYQALTFFFSLHYIMPMGMILIIIFHFLGLHFKGSSSPILFSTNWDKMKFYPFYMFKDFLNFLVMLIPFICVSLWMAAEGENFLMANPLQTPAHIKPEWYFLFAYAILRSFPHKLGGVLLMAGAVLMFYTLPFINMMFMEKFQWSLHLFLIMFFMLTWIGHNEAIDLFTLMGLLFSCGYFMYPVLLFTNSLIMIIFMKN